MTPRGARRTVWRVGIPYALRTIGIVALVAIVVSIFAVEPKPALSGDGLWVSLSLAGLVAGAVLAMPWREMTEWRRLGGLTLIGAASVAPTGVQPDGARSAAGYVVVVVAAMRLPIRPALAITALIVGGEVLVTALFVPESGGKISGLLFLVIPWFLFIRLMRQIRESGDRAEALVEELRESREETAQAAAVAERSRLARDMHDVLAHSLSALALQLEGARLLARDRGADEEVVAAIERAHHLAGTGRSEARSAIAALRGDELPALDALAERFGDRVELSVRGEPRELASEARLAVYRTAQEALTNVSRHSAAEHVSLALAYEADGTRLVVEDGGPATGGNGSAGGGYGLTGMRERAELLGGQLNAGPAGDGFKVELWLPA